MICSLDSILLSVSTVILSILWIIALQQVCMTDMSDKKRIVNTISVACFSTFGVIYSAVGYLSTMHPHFILYHPVDLVILSHIFDVIMDIFGIHIFRIYQLAIINRLYSLINILTPKWIKILLYSIEIILVIICLTCYLFAYIFTNLIPWMHIFYTLLGIAILIQAIFMLYMLRRLLKILYNIEIIRNINDAQINSARRAMKLAVCIAILLIIISIQFIVVNIKNFDDNISIYDTDSLIDDITHSIFMFVLTTALILGIYQQYKCCAIYENSVCIAWGCGGFWAWCCTDCGCKHYHNYTHPEYKNGDNNDKNHCNKTEILLHESMSQSHKIPAKSSTKQHIQTV